MTEFTLGRLPRIEFGRGRRRALPAALRAWGTRLLVVTGARSFVDGPHWAELEAGLREAGMESIVVRVSGEPTASFVDEVVAHVRATPIDVVLGIGGGSAIDAAKAIAGMLRPGHSVMDHLEGVGPERPYRGPATPFVAVPTTAGTGSEVTRNAVLGVPASGGVKKSFRDERLVAALALVDPDLLDGCPRHVAVACGLDAFTQLLESYVSTRATALTDALSWRGLIAIGRSLVACVDGVGDRAACRDDMAGAALLSGITLSHAGLGVVHGLASPLGGMFPIPHGTACGAVVAAATRVNVAALRARDPAHVALAKYAEVGRLLACDPALDDPSGADALVAWLTATTAQLAVPGLARYGVTGDRDASVIDGARAASSIRTNPVQLTDGEMVEILDRSR